MRRLGQFLLLSMAAGLVMAQTPPARTARITLTPPTAWEDGTAINCAVAGTCRYHVYRGGCNSPSKERVITGVSEVTFPVTNSVPGQCFTASVVVAGIESLQSPEVRYRGNPGAPAISVIVTVVVEPVP